MSNDTILYASVDRNAWMTQSSMVRWRSCYRGVRESYKLNHEITSFIYDLRRIMESHMESEEKFLDYLNVLMNGGLSLNAYTQTPEVTIVTPPTDGGSTDSSVLPYNSNQLYDSVIPYQGI